MFLFLFLHVGIFAYHSWKALKGLVIYWFYSMCYSCWVLITFRYWLLMNAYLFLVYGLLYIILQWLILAVLSLLLLFFAFFAFLISIEVHFLWDDGVTVCLSLLTFRVFGKFMITGIFFFSFLLEFPVYEFKRLVTLQGILKLTKFSFIRSVWDQCFRCFVDIVARNRSSFEFDQENSYPEMAVDKIVTMVAHFEKRSFSFSCISIRTL